jgi:hypothetical protein
MPLDAALKAAGGSSCGGGAKASADRRRLQQDVEGAELHLVIVQPAMQRVEVGNAINAQDHGLTIEDENASPGSACRFPLDSRLEIEAMVLNRDIGFVYPDQDAEIKVDTFNFTRYGLLHGKVLSISQDAIARDKPQDKGADKIQGAEASSSEPKGQELVYAARISLDRVQMQVEDKAINLAPGMAVLWRSRLDRDALSVICCRRCAATSRRLLGRDEFRLRRTEEILCGEWNREPFLAAMNGCVDGNLASISTRL